MLQDDKETEPQENLPDMELAEDAAVQTPAEPSAEEKAQSYWDQLLRLQADFANYRKRTEREKSEAVRFGKHLMIERMVSLLDVMDSAVKHSQDGSDLKSVKKGFEMVVQEFERLLKSEGVESIKSVGESFDPHRHEAVEQIETDDESENNLVREEVQKGYIVDGKMLRPARVKVARIRKENQQIKE